jgi:hypothetical protein
MCEQQSQQHLRMEEIKECLKMCFWQILKDLNKAPKFIISSIHCIAALLDRISIVRATVTTALKEAEKLKR